MKTELKGRESLKVVALPGVHNYAKGSKLEGSSYRRFAYGGKVFIANAEDAFCTAFDKGTVYSIDLDSNEEGQLSLVGHTTTTQELNMAKTEVLLSSFTVENFVAGKILNPEELIA
jgi:hypothetical protein